MVLWITMCKLLDGLPRDIHGPHKINPADFDPCDFLTPTTMHSHLWLLLKCLNNYWMDCPEILVITIQLFFLRYNQVKTFQYFGV